MKAEIFVRVDSVESVAPEEGRRQAEAAGLDAEGPVRVAKVAMRYGIEPDVPAVQCYLEPYALHLARGLALLMAEHPHRYAGSVAFLMELHLPDLPEAAEEEAPHAP